MPTRSISPSGSARTHWISERLTNLLPLLWGKVGARHRSRGLVARACQRAFVSPRFTRRERGAEAAPRGVVLCGASSAPRAAFTIPDSSTLPSLAPNPVEPEPKDMQRSDISRRARALGGPFRASPSLSCPAGRARRRPLLPKSSGALSGPSRAAVTGSVRENFGASISDGYFPRRGRHEPSR